MLHLTLRSEYSFGRCFGFLKSIYADYAKNGYIGVSDWNTFSFYKLQQLCKVNGDTPVYGYRCTVVKDATEKVKPRGQFGKPYIIIAKNKYGIKEIFKLTSITSKNFYYRGNVSVSDIESLSNNVFVISTDPIANRLDYIGMGFTTPDKVKQYNHPKIFVDENFYSSGVDKKVYQLYAGRNSNDKSCPQKILTEEEAIYYFGKECVDELSVLASQIEKFDLPCADNVKYKGVDTIVDKAIKGARGLGVDLKNPIYKERFHKEINLIQAKGYSDYLMVVSEIIQEAKKYAFMGSGRGSSGGSLVCYLLGITTFDPIPYGLVFERFIDVNRYDPPDVDFDVPDKYRSKVVKWMEDRYGVDNVKTISNITKFKPKSAIGEFAKVMNIPKFETEAVKDVIIDRAAGDARASFALKDTFENTDVGMEFINKFPEMKNVTHIENHAKQKGKHAAGVIICNEKITNYCGVDERDQTVYLDKKDAEAVNLLKIDVLGLRTLSVLQDCARSVGMDYNDFYTLPLDDSKAYEVFASKRLCGIFQFEGEAMASINDSAPMERFEDIVAAGALGRPGALSSGGTSRYVQLKNGKREPLYYCDIHKKLTEETFGIVVYQEQMMTLCKEIADMTWEEVTDIRRAASKSLGNEYFSKYKDIFVKGAVRKSRYKADDAEKVWLDISDMGCLSGSTMLQNPFPNQNQYQTRISIKDLYESGGYSSVRGKEICDLRQRNRYNTSHCLRQNLYMVCEDGEIRPRRLVDIYESGIKTTYLLTVVDQDGKARQIRATMDHKFMIPGMNFKKLSEFCIGDKIVMQSSRKIKSLRYKGVGTGAHNHTGDHLNDEEGNHKAIRTSCHRKARVELGNHGIPHKRGEMQSFSEVVSITDPEEEMTYDISMPYPHNFIANGFAVHNSYSFNKSHSVAYGIISYWCAFMKARHPLQFIASILNNSKDDDSSLKILREFYETENLKFKAIDARNSGVEWELHGDKLIGGLTNIKGVGKIKALSIIKARNGTGKMTPGIINVMQNPKTPFDVLYPTLFHFEDMYKNPMNYGLHKVHRIVEVSDPGEYAIIGKMVHVNDIDVNDVQSIAKRGGEVLDGPHMKVHIRIEDDSGVMMCIVNRFIYDQISHEFLRTKVGATWFCLIGKVLEGNKILFISKVANLNNQVGLREDEENRNEDHRRIIMEGRYE